VENRSRPQRSARRRTTRPPGARRGAAGSSSPADGPKFPDLLVRDVRTGQPRAPQWVTPQGVDGGHGGVHPRCPRGGRRPVPAPSHRSPPSARAARAGPVRPAGDRARRTPAGLPRAGGVGLGRLPPAGGAGTGTGLHPGRASRPDGHPPALHPPQIDRDAVRRSPQAAGRHRRGGRRRGRTDRPRPRRPCRRRPDRPPTGPRPSPDRPGTEPPRTTVTTSHPRPPQVLWQMDNRWILPPARAPPPSPSCRTATRSGRPS